MRPTPTGHKSRVFYFNDMAKRFTDNGKWDDPWFAELPSKYKLFYLYLLDECDHAGVWKVNFRKAQFMVGESLEQSEVRRYMGDRIRIVDDAYWFVTKFIRFQYGSLKGDKVSASVSSILEKHGLTDIIEEQTEGAIKGLPSPYVGAKDKDKEKDKDKDKESIMYSSSLATNVANNISKQRGHQRDMSPNVGDISASVSDSSSASSSVSSKRIHIPKVDEVAAYCTERNNSVDAQAFCDYYESKGWVVGRTPMKSWQAAVRTWERTSTNQTGGKNGYRTKDGLNPANAAFHYFPETKDN